jgi:hypothetical protein
MTLGEALSALCDTVLRVETAFRGNTCWFPAISAISLDLIPLIAASDRIRGAKTNEVQQYERSD